MLSLNEIMLYDSCVDVRCRASSVLMDVYFSEATKAFVTGRESSDLSFLGNMMRSLSLIRLRNAVYPVVFANSRRGISEEPISSRYFASFFGRKRGESC